MGQSSLASPLHQGPLFSGSRQLHFYHFSFLSRFPPICPACGPGASFQLAQPALLLGAGPGWPAGCCRQHQIRAAVLPLQLALS